VAIRNWMVFSLDVLTTREDAWDRAAIVRGFWDCPDFEWCRCTKARASGCWWKLSAAVCVATAAAAAGDGRAACDRRGNGRGTICPGPRIT
jgi:hypothetical protein